MKIKTFIEKAIEGGIILHKNLHGKITVDSKNITFATKDVDGYVGRETIPISTLLLRPDAWEAVGKVEGWTDRDFKASYKTDEFDLVSWRYKMHAMIDHLIAGNDIESYIKTL